MKHPLILTDADNTLWDTNSVFANAQIGLLSLVENATGKTCKEDDRLAFVRRYDQALAAIHHAHLKYPPTLLVRALAAGLDGLDAAKAAELALKGKVPILDHAAVDLTVQQYLAMLRNTPELLPTVIDGLTAAHTAEITVYVLTEGLIEKQKNILLHYGLTQFVTDVFEVTKNQAQFERLRQRFTLNEVIVMGDQPDRDIVPAKNAGCTTVLVPSCFRPHWHNAEHGKISDYIATTFADGVKWVLQHAADKY